MKIEILEDESLEGADTNTKPQVEITSNALYHLTHYGRLKLVIDGEIVAAIYTEERW